MASVNDSMPIEFNHLPLSVLDGIAIFSADDRYVDNYKRIAADHLAAMKPESDNPYIENALWTELEQSTRDLIEKHVPAGSAVLDVGVGLGRVMAPLTQYRRYGIDISLDYLRLTRDRGIEVAFARVEDMPYRDASFDAIVTCDVLEHLVEFDQGIKQILRVLKPGGHLIVRVPYREDLKVYLRDDLPYEYIHLRNFDEHSIRLYFEKIHRCKLLETTLVAAYWQGETRLRYRLPPEAVELRTLVDDARLAEAGLDEEGAGILRGLLAVSEEKLVAWINRIKQESPPLFELVKSHLILDIEMNAVIQKPF